jgi:drug/metabolite transporter (DMT)-like permease
MGVALAIVAAIGWGSSDYIAGRAARRSTALVIAAVSQLTGLVIVIVLAPLLPGQPTASDLAWGALAGIASSTGLVALYRGLAIGPMSVVAPATACFAAVIPVAIGTTLGQGPRGIALPGVILALIAIVALSTDADDEIQHLRIGRLARAVPVSLAAGLGFGVFYVALDQTGSHAGLWPLIGAQLAAVPLLWSMLLARGAPSPRAVAPSAVAVGALEIAGACATLIALRHQSLPVVAVISSLYPAATIALAAVVANERVGAKRLAWCGVAVVAVALTAASPVSGDVVRRPWNAPWRAELVLRAPRPQTDTRSRRRRSHELRAQSHTPPRSGLAARPVRARSCGVRTDERAR